jgi:NADH:ubiquinone oxidoreductase subunit E
MKTNKPRKERTEKQKENDVKLKERLTEYHKRKKQAKEVIALQHIQDTLDHVQEQKEIEEMVQIVDEPIADVVEVVKARRGRPKKHNHPAASTEIKEIRSIDDVCSV